MYFVFFYFFEFLVFFFFKRKTAYEMRISDWSSDVCSSDLPVDTSSRGNHTKAKKCWLSGLSTSTILGRGRSDNDMEVSATCSRSLLLKLISRSCGNAVSACTSAFPACPTGSKPNFSIRVASAERSSGTSSGGALNAELVQRPAWTESAVILSPSRTGRRMRSISARRCTHEMWFDLTISGLGLPDSNQAKAASIEWEDSNGSPRTAQMPICAPASPPRSRNSCTNWVRRRSRTQQIGRANV